MSFSKKHGITSNKPPKLEVDINDGGLLYHDPRFGNRYAKVMRALIQVYQDRVAVSASDDMELLTDSDDIIGRASELRGELFGLYSELVLPHGQTADSMVERWESKLLTAAKGIKPTYDRWEKAQSALDESEARDR